jgi:hypothetical protein
MHDAGNYGAGCPVNKEDYKAKSRYYHSPANPYLDSLNSWFSFYQRNDFLSLDF